MKIPFNIPYSTGQELNFIKESLGSGQISGNGMFSLKCQDFLYENFGFSKVLLTPSCTDALEMSAMLLDIRPGDEVIVPAYTFVSTALAFERQGARIVFADSREDSPCMDTDNLESLITANTRAIVPVHYNGFACDMDRIMEIAGRHGLFVVEDAAHAFGSRYKGKLLGTIGHLGCFSYHETKIIHCGEGGMISVNHENFRKRAEIIWEKGTNRSDFRKGIVSKYEWVDTGSSFLLSDISAAYLYAQLKGFNVLMERRKVQWEEYYNSLADPYLNGSIKLPPLDENVATNHSGFYFTTGSHDIRLKLEKFLNSKGIQAVSHYLDLSQSPYIRSRKDYHTEGKLMKNASRFEKTLLRLPLYFQLGIEDIRFIAGLIKTFYSENDF